MFRNKRALIAVLGLVALSALVFGCAAEEEATPTAAVVGEMPTIVGETPTVVGETPTVVGETPKRGGVLQLYRTTSTRVHDPHPTVGVSSLFSGSTAKLFQQPFGGDVDPTDITPVKELVESWEISEDGLTYTFHLKKGVMWEDKPPVNGREFECRDVKATVERILTVSAHMWAYQLGDTLGCECPDKYTVKWNMAKPYAPLIVMLTSTWASMMPYEQTTVEGAFDRPENLVALGPFKFKSYLSDVSEELERNPTYWRASEGLPYLDGLKWTVIPDVSTRLAAIRSGQIELSGGFPPSEADTLLKTAPGLMYTEYETLSGWAIAFRSDRPPWNDVRVRQAVSLAINHQEWVDTLLMGKGVVDNGPIPAGMPLWKVPTEELGEGAKYYGYDPEEAKRLLAEAGYPDGLKCEFLFYGTVPSYMLEQFELIKDYLDKAGFDVTLQAMEYGAYADQVWRWGEYDDMCYSGQWVILDPDLTLWGFYYPGQSTNISHTDDPYLTDLLEKQRVELDFEKRWEIVAEIQRYLAVQIYRLSAPYYNYTAFWQPWVKNYTPKVYGGGGVYTSVWLDK